MPDYAVRTTRLSYTYPDGTRALEEVDLDVRVGERVAIVGPSSAGKSTLLLHLNGSLRGTGTVRILGQTLDDASLKESRRHLGLVFQNPDDQLFCPTVFQDVAFGPLNLGVAPREIPREVEKVLRNVGLEQSVRNRPSRHLSYGERKRVALASVLIMQPEILALDDPSSNLDPRTRRQIVQVVDSLPATLILATHDLEMVSSLCTRTVVMDHGKVCADGETRGVFEDTRLMEDHGLEPPLNMR